MTHECCRPFTACATGRGRCWAKAALQGARIGQVHRLAWRLGYAQAHAWGGLRRCLHRVLPRHRAPAIGQGGTDEILATDLSHHRTQKASDSTLEARRHRSQAPSPRNVTPIAQECRSLLLHRTDSARFPPSLPSTCVLWPTYSCGRYALPQAAELTPSPSQRKNRWTGSRMPMGRSGSS